MGLRGVKLGFKHKVGRALRLQTEHVCLYKLRLIHRFKSKMGAYTLIDLTRD